MEPTYRSIADLVPENAARFFEEASEQRVVLFYPEHVQATVSPHHGRFQPHRPLH
jgi:hypothetical protein